MSKLLAYTIGGQKIGVDITSWNSIILSGNSAFMTIPDAGTPPLNYSNISSFNNWANFGQPAGFTEAQVKNELIKLIPNTPTQDQYNILANYMNVGINSMTKIGDTIELGSVITGGTYLTGIKDIKLNVTGSTASGNTVINGAVISQTLSGLTSVVSPNIFATTTFYEGGLALSTKYASKTTAITGGTNLGSGNGTLYTSVNGNKIQLKTLSGGTNITLTCNGNYIAINATSGGGGINWSGSTANGIGTYVSSTKICSNPKLTFNGTSLSITGNIYASTYVCSPIISGGTCVVSPYVCGKTCICSPTLCATTNAFAPTPAVNNNSICVATTAWYFGQCGTATPLMDGSAAVGTSTLWSKQDHRHPSDTTKLFLTGGTMTGGLSYSGADIRFIRRTTNNCSLEIMGGSSEATGAYFQITGSGNTSSPYGGSAEFVIRNLAQSQFTLQSYDGISTWTPRFSVAGLTGLVTICNNLNVSGITTLASTTCLVATPATGDRSTDQTLLWNPTDKEIKAVPAIRMLCATTVAGGTTVTCASAVCMNGMCIPNVPAGTYLLSFGTSMCHTSNGGIVRTCIFVGGAAVAGSERMFQRGTTQSVASTHDYAGFPITLGSTATVEIRWLTSASTGCSLCGRNLSLLRVG